VEILGCDDSEWKALPPLSCGPIIDCIALSIDETASELGQVLLLCRVLGSASAVHTVDLATGVCTPQPSSFNPRYQIVAARLPDGRIVCSTTTLGYVLGQEGRPEFTASVEILGCDA
jgi:hypothetical protein